MQAIIEIRPHRGGWQCFEGQGVAPYWIGPHAKESALDYAKARTVTRRGEIRIYTSTGEIEQAIPFDQHGRKITDA